MKSYSFKEYIDLIINHAKEQENYGILINKCIDFLKNLTVLKVEINNSEKNYTNRTLSFLGENLIDSMLHDDKDATDVYFQMIEFALSIGLGSEDFTPTTKSLLELSMRCNELLDLVDKYINIKCWINKNTVGHRIGLHYNLSKDNVGHLLGDFMCFMFLRETIHEILDSNHQSVEQALQPILYPIYTNFAVNVTLPYYMAQFKTANGETLDEESIKENNISGAVFSKFLLQNFFRKEGNDIAANSSHKRKITDLIDTYYKKAR